MGNIESVTEHDISNPKVGKIVYRKEKYTIKDIISHYNCLIKRAYSFEEENKRLIKDLNICEKTIDKLRRELSQLKNVLDLKSTEKRGESNSKMTENLPSGRHAVSAEQYVPKEDPKFFTKSIETKTMIQEAFGRNDFLEHLDKTQLAALSECMTPVCVEAGHYIINEGEEGSSLYVVEEGELEVYKRGVKISKTPLRRGVLFGELAILYECTRTASVLATTKTKLWCTTRELFQGVMRYNVTVRRDEHFKFFKMVPVLSKINEPMLRKLADASEEVYFGIEDAILKEGTKGESFYIIKSGTVNVFTQNEKGEVEVLRTLSKGDSFGEKALLKDEIRSASVTATTQVTCLILSKQMFLGIHGEVLDAMDQEYKKTVIEQPTIHKSLASQVPKSRLNLVFSDFRQIVTLGQGAFGKVELVEHAENKKRFALKRMDKQHIIKTKQQQHVNNERNFLLVNESVFIVRLHQTFKDSKYVYLLMDACLGGDLFSILHTIERFDIKAARFYVGCVVMALDYIHTKNFIYRDLKPENIIMDSTGYVKLVDFGFTKLVPEGEKTFTFCGTPEYVAPEVILSKGHDKSCDLWSLGILVYELINGSPPFTSSDSMTTYRMILRGLDVISFPKKIPKNACLLTKSLCRDNPLKRLGSQKEGMQEVKNHPFFDNFNWKCLKERTLPSPLIPKVGKHNLKDSSPKLALVTSNLPDTLGEWDENF